MVKKETKNKTKKQHYSDTPTIVKKMHNMSIAFFPNHTKKAPPVYNIQKFYKLASGNYKDIRMRLSIQEIVKLRFLIDETLREVYLSKKPAIKNAIDDNKDEDI